MKRFIIILCIYCFSGSDAMSQQSVEIYTYDVLPPFAFRDESGALTGVYIETVREVVSRMKDYDVTFKVVPWSRAKKETERGKAFAILPPYFHAHDWLTETEPKRPYIWPYSLALATQYDVVICNEKVARETRTNYPDDYLGLRFVMFRGDGRAGARFDEMVKNKRIKLQLIKNVEDSIKFLLLGRADCTITSRLPFAWYIKQLKKSGDYAKLNDKNTRFKEMHIISSNEGYLGYTDIDDEKNFPFKKDFAIKFDSEFYKMRKQGDVQTIINRFIE
ncbi:MAG: substrate-binding periplasmic protein [Arenicella sp.]